MKKFFKKIPFDYRSQPNVFWNHCFVAIASYVVGLIMTICFGIFTGFSFNTYNPDVPPHCSMAHHHLSQHPVQLPTTAQLPQAPNLRSTTTILSSENNSRYLIFNK